MTSKEVIKFQQPDKNIPIEFFRIEDSLELFNFDYYFQYDFYQIFWITQAHEQVQQIDFVNYAMETNQLWVTYPGQVQYFNPTDIRGYYLAIDKDYFNRIVYLQMTPSVFAENAPLLFQVPQDKGPLFHSLLHLFDLEWKAEKRTELLEQYLAIYLIHIQDLALLSQPRVHYDDRTSRILALVEQQYTQQWTASQYAASIGISVKRMNEVLVQTTAHTVTQHIHSRLLLEAKRLLGYTTSNVQEIAAELGFSEVNYFNRFFKKHTQLSPLQFRKQVKKVQ